VGPAALLVYVDDATSWLMELRFGVSESAFSYFASTKRYLEQHGKPVAFYSDKASIFRVVDARGKQARGDTQFGRALSELNIDSLCANTPQAKGRVERAHLTLQDRLVKELRLRGISTPEAGNAYLPEFTQDYNARFSCEPQSPRRPSTRPRGRTRPDLHLAKTESFRRTSPSTTKASSHRRSWRNDRSPVSPVASGSRARPHRDPLPRHPAPRGSSTTRTNVRQEHREQAARNGAHEDPKRPIREDSDGWPAVFILRDKENREAQAEACLRTGQRFQAHLLFANTDMPRRHVRSAA
jgi:hypothetical protein